MLKYIIEFYLVSFFLRKMSQKQDIQGQQYCIYNTILAIICNIKVGCDVCAEVCELRLMSANAVVLVEL